MALLPERLKNYEYLPEDRLSADQKKRLIEVESMIDGEILGNEKFVEIMEKDGFITFVLPGKNCLGEDDDHFLRSALRKRYLSAGYLEFSYEDDSDVSELKGIVQEDLYEAIAAEIKSRLNDRVTLYLYEK